MSLQKSLDEVIKQNLPAELSDVLQKRLLELEGKEKELEEVKDELKKSAEKNSALMEVNVLLNSSLCEAEKSLSVFKKREEDLITKEQDLRVEKAVLDVKMVHTTETINIVTELHKVPFKNSVLRENILSQVPLKTSSILYGNYDPNIGRSSETVAENETLESAQKTVLTEKS